MQEKTLNVEMRSERGKNASNRLIEAGYVPAVIYSHGESEALKVERKEFKKLFKSKVSESVIFDVKIKDKSHDEMMAFVKAYQVDPITGEIIHLDFFRVTTGEEISTQVPVELEGTPVGIKLGGILEVSDRVIEVKCLPRLLPEKIVVDLSPLEIGDAVHAKDLKLQDGVALMSNPDVLIVAVTKAKGAAEGEEVEAAAEGAAEETASEE